MVPSANVRAGKFRLVPKYHSESESCMYPPSFQAPSTLLQKLAYSLVGPFTPGFCVCFCICDAFSSIAFYGRIHTHQWQISAKRQSKPSQTQTLKPGVNGPQRPTGLLAIAKANAKFRDFAIAITRYERVLTKDHLYLV